MIRRLRWPLSNAVTLWFCLFTATWLVSNYSRAISKAFDARWLIKYPAGWRVPLKDNISNAMQWLIEDASFGLFSFTDLTRGISWLIDQPYNLALALLSSGLVEGQGLDAIQILPPLSWIVVTALVVALGHYAKDWWLATLVGVAFLYLAVFGQWDSAMITLASILISVPFGVAAGLLLGIAAFKWPWVDRLLKPVLDLMQTIPIFAYLVPILFMFGFGPVSALVATIIYAMPPMVRVTTLALRSVPAETIDFGVMAGCTQKQMLWKVLIPSSKSALMIGVNQVIMLSLNMVIIASMIGAGGLGYDVLASLRRLDIGAGLEAGVAIVVLAIALDRLSQAFAHRRVDQHRKVKDKNLLRRYPRAALITLIGITCMIGGYFWPILQTYPESMQLTTGAFWEDLVRYININYFDQLEAVKTFLLLNFLLPIKRFLTGIPWPWGLAVISFIGYRLGGWRMALLTFALTAFIVTNGLWDKAMTTVYLCGASVIIAMLIGVPVGVLSATNQRADRIVSAIIDTLQTLPSFVYLIPVVMLFRVGDFSAMIAVVLYSLAPAVRYAAHGVKSINPQLIEAGIVSGCKPLQLLWRIRMPLALPEIMLGVNQTVMLALSMLVITALVGTRDLGQEVYIALTRADTGHGLVAGLSIAFIAIIADRLITLSAQRARQKFGLVE
ncbi:MAG: glycine betaine/proline transport system permease protein [Gammaproteobacteria bacterium]|jgi:glycine betaine/proline transport system permease protein